MIKALIALTGAIMFWNLENMFLPWGVSDEFTADFRSGGKKGWNYGRFLAKANRIAKTVVYLEDSLGMRIGLIAFAEVENRQTVDMLVRHTVLHKYDYGIVHYDSDDRRGIDVALLYDREAYRLLGSRNIHVMMDSSVLRTRTILYASLLSSANDTVHVFVNHHPSKFSGESRTAVLRQAALGTLAAAVDSVISAGGTKVIITGDFNEVPLTDTLAGVPGFTNLAYSLHRRGEGTIKFGGKWELIDHFIVSGALRSSVMYVFAPYFLKERDRKYLGWKPFRTYVGPRYNGGVSDHFPVVMEF